ncbi:hypothetical protein Q8A67_015441 [Cirrhinus molitorella]|uniref:XK-related protein n=1 Tax=Cirrhinus molitorella TaxID=172907 RepID=A0AA88PEP9_9TELE|nr:hypothetical protein Q8A67_015441 [Cirrhinus molitorella]
MNCMTFPKYSSLDLFFTVIGVCTYLFDIGSDLWVAKVFYVHGEFMWFGVLVGFMLMSSLVVQLFSWFWLTYDRDLKDFITEPTGSVVLLSEAKSVKLLLVLHVFQLGFFIRHISAIWQGFHVWWKGGFGSESDYAVYLTHDLSMLRLIETFCESAPQLTLMMYIMLRSNHARLVQYISVVASTTSIAWMVVDYHRALRSFLPDKDKQNWLSSVVYFFWNLFLIGPRVATVALFASVLPCYITAHFLCLWLVFAIWACIQGTDFMDSLAGECLYRATVGLIWYFSWFNDGAYVYMAVLIFLLLGSSVFLQVFSWLWYSDYLGHIETKVEKFADRHLLIKPFHFLQLGVYLRYAGVIEISTTHFVHRTNSFTEGVAVYLNHDLQMLRLFETFSESTPQLILMMSIILQRGELELITGLKILTSAAAIASSVAMYHRSMRAFLPKKRKMSWFSTGVYFLWNLLLIIPRVTALALFCSVLPCFIIAHFLSLWMLLVLVAWRHKTSYMEHPGWEWLFRAAVGLIWYAGVIETSTMDLLHRISNFRNGVRHSIREDGKLKYDFLMLRLIEAFSENVPQLTLILSRILQRGELELITGLKILTTAAAIAFNVALYHQGMHVSGSKGCKMSWMSTMIYFLWNLLLIIPRVTALALFCSVLPCYIIAHFLSLWMLLVLVVWSQKTDHMKSPGWEWLFRAAVGLIWYFSWFNVSKKGSLKVKMAIYCSLMALDTMLLLGFWCWKVFEYAGCWSSLNPYVVIPTLLVLIFLLLGSSVLLQVFSWIWYSDSLEHLETTVEKLAKKHLLIKPFHFLQLGVYLRYAGVIETSTKDLLHQTNSFTEGMAMHLNQDFQMVRLFETFSESAPQLILMMSIILQRRELELITGIKFLTSAAAIASSVALYHRSMRSYLPEKCKMRWISTGVYFLWNFLLIIPRVTALALFCSVLPCFIIAHFLSLWMLLVLVVWRQKTNYMEHCEWLFSAAVGLIWYFSWFSVTKKSIKLKMVLYYSLITLDTMILLGLWCWKVVEYADCWSSLNPYVVIPTLLGVYGIGISVKIIYYRWFHPNCDAEKTAQPTEKVKYRRAASYALDLDPLEDVAAAPAQPLTGVLKRSKTIAANFYF